MTTALERVTAARQLAQAQPRAAAKAFREPPFWSLDSMGSSFGSSLADRETLEHSFEGYAAGAGKADGIVYACFYARLRHFAQAMFRWQNKVSGELFGNPELRLLERPWPTGTTGDLLAWMEVDASFAGNSYWTFADDAGRLGRAASGPSRRLVRLRPDWVWIVIGSASGDPFAADARIVAFIYWPRVSGGAGTFGRAEEQVTLLPTEVAHYAPVPDPQARFRGMSWLTPVLREVAADRAATQHKLRFFERGASLQTIVALDKDVSVEAFDEFVERFRATHEGTDNAFKTLFIGGGADVTTTSADLSQLDYRHVQGAGETRIAAAAGVHPVIVGLSEGLAGSSLNAGNYRAAVRNFGDGTCTHLWQVASASLANLVTPPNDGSRLVVDKTAIPFLAEDAKDLAEIQQVNATALRSLVDAGFDPDAAVEYLRSNDLGKLMGRHSGLFSVQLQPPGSETPAPAPAAEPPEGRAGYENGWMKNLLARGMP